MTYESHVADIVTIQAGLAGFWSKAHGWAPSDGATLLASARLDWTPSLARSLHRWIEPPTLSDGDLILAWANLGSIMESSLRLFFGVYINDYNNSAEDLAAIDALRKKGAKKGQHYPPDELAMEKIRQLIERRKIFPDAERKLIGIIQSRRNAIHSFNDREIGSTSEFRVTVADYRVFIANMASRLPYPDDRGFHWLELAGTIWVKAAYSTRD
ncbi:hypothetical protein FA04_02935 [Ensifer adhaerens]|uniref:RiboL-PSP-HEPN domain-containing protein n=1 Tax=Ensifer adhaerens TaxID=106592 RepID=A0ABY8HGV0_ENSAD|nr:hypothetical protein [Ensifer adhaerens]ANK71678.1 hypothetical protein FA04_02935 [Ensifer adhaerens]KDP72169.1 hypothetical protein FA04_20510 [Ensifer adhaerens]WFP91354.1 hypothetical protein P4B07_02955 [Ensifer adhaerens]